MPTISSDYFYFSKDGLMWFSTSDGLSSFDGSEIVNYCTPEQTFEFGLNRIRTIAEDDSDNLYIGGDTRLSFFNRKSKTFSQLTYYSPETKESFDISAHSIYIADTREVYVGTDSKGLLIYSPRSKSFQHVNLMTEKSDCWDDDNLNTVASFAEHATDTSKLWIGTFNGIYLFDKKNKRLSKNFYVVNPGVNKYQQCPVLYDIRKMDVADDSTIWFSTISSGFAKYNTRTGLVKLYLHDSRLKTKDLWKAYTLKQFAKFENGKYVLGIIDPNPAIFDVHTEKLQWLNVTQQPGVYDEVQYVANDRLGNVWLLSKGILYISLPNYLRLQSTSIEKQTTPDYFPNRLGDIFFDSATSNYYAAVPFSSGVYVLDKNLAVKEIVPVPLTDNRYTYHETSNEYITKDGCGRIWTTCLNTYIMNPGTKKFVFAENISPSLKWLKGKGEFWDITATISGNILLRFENGMVYHIDCKTLLTDSIKLPEISLASYFIIGNTRINYDGTRNILYLNNLKGIYRYSFSSHQLATLPESELFGNYAAGPQLIEYPMDDQGRLFSSDRRSRQVIEYALDDSGRLWVWIPRFGIRIIDPDNLQCLDSIPNGTRGLLAGNYNYMRYGGKDCMLFVGQRGVVIYNYKKQASLLFDGSNGWSQQADYFKGHCNNHIFISGRNQLEYYNLADFSKFDLELQPSLNTVTAGTTPVFTRGSDDDNIKITIPYNQNSLTFSFSAPEFYFPERIEYSYQLLNADKDWQYANSFNRKITYTQLSPGKYVFRLRAQITGANWNVKTIEYNIIIERAFWQTWWFKLVVGLALLSLLILFSRRRINLVRKKSAEKAQHEKELLDLEARALRSQMNPHFIFNCMNSIKALIQQQEDEKAITYLTTFSKLIRTLFNNADKKEITLYDEIETCKLYLKLEKVRFDSKFSYAVTVDDFIDMKSITIPALVIQPFIENAIWHGIISCEKGGHIDVSVERKNSSVQIIIDDNGIGRAASARSRPVDGIGHQSKGVNLTQSRLRLDNLLKHRQARLEIIDKKSETGTAEGTRVIIYFDDQLS